MSQVTPNELFGFSEYFALLDQGKAESLKFSESLVSSFQRIGVGFNETMADARKMLGVLDTLNVAQKNGGQIVADYAAKAAEAAKKLESLRQTQTNLSDAQRMNNELLTDLGAKLLSLQQRYNNLDPKAKGYAAQQRAILSEVRVVTRAIEAQNKTLQVATSSVNAAEGSYDHLKKQTNELRKALSAMPDAYEKGTGAINRQNKAAVALNDQYQKNLLMLSRVEKGQGIFSRNVGNYPTTSSGGGGSMLGTIAGAAGIATGAGAAIMIGQKAVETASKIGEVTLEFDSLDAALNVVSNDTLLLTQRQTMLQRESERLGIDLSVVEKNYTSLTASSMNTRLEGEKTDKIFLAITGTMARLKKPAVDVERALLAVGQMISKNTVQSEELRGQLSEVLPGAYAAAARAMGVTTSKLSDMLKNGEVLASDLLPKLAVELENTFNPNHEKSVEGLASEMARGRNEGVEWVKWMNIGDKAAAFIGSVTGMARSIREFFSPAVKLSTSLLDKQTESLQTLESQLPDLLTRYDELKAKSKLSADEQRELQTVINNLVSLAPSAAEGFDQYGNALDVNKGKVLSFAAAQRELNAELNKQALADLRVETSSGMQRASLTQSTLNRGTEQKSFNMKPFFLMSAEERRQATDKDAGKRREVPLSDARTLELQKQLQAQNKEVELSLVKRLQLGDKLSAADEAYIEKSGSSYLRQYKQVQDYNAKIDELTLKQGDLLLKADKKSLAERENVLKELAGIQAKRNDLLNPKLAEMNKEKPVDEDLLAKQREKAAQAAKKAQAEADRRLREAMSKSQAANQRELAELTNLHQDGLISEQDFIEKRLALTIAGLDERQKLLERAGKKETDDYQKVLRDKLDADSDYKRAQLKTDLASSKGRTSDKLSGIEEKRQEGGLSEMEFLEQRRDIQKKGVEEQLTILRESGQEQSALYKEIYAGLSKADADYYKDRLKVIKKAYRDEQSAVRDGLGEIDQTMATEYEDSLNSIGRYYEKQEAEVRKQVAGGKLTSLEGDEKSHALTMERLEAERSALESFYMRDQQLSDDLIQEKISKLDELKAAGIATPAEIEAAENQIRELKKLRDKDAADDKIRLVKKVGENEQQTSNETAQNDEKNANKLIQKRRALMQMSQEIAELGGEAVFSIVQGNLDRESAQLDKQKENELRLAGDNADARARIEEQYNRKQAEIRRKQAIADREQALFKIGLSTAMGVASVLSTGGGTAYADLGISAGILTAFVIATGALQAAAVLSKPLPNEFWKGSSNTPEGPAYLAERGPEIRQRRDGSMTLYSKPTLEYLGAGERIYTADQTKRLAAEWQRDEATRQAMQEAMLLGSSAEKLTAGRLAERVVIASGGMSRQDMSVLADLLGREMEKRPLDVTEIGEDFTRKIRKATSGYTEYVAKRYP